MFVNIVDRGNDGADVRGSLCGNAGVVTEKAPDDDVDVALFDEFGRIGKVGKRLEVGEQTAVKGSVAEIVGQRFRLKDAAEVVGIPLPDDEDIVRIARRGGQGVHGAFSDEDDIVLFADGAFAVHFTADAAAEDIQDFDTAVKMRKRVRVPAVKKVHRVCAVVPCFVEGKVFHDVNFW